MSSGADGSGAGAAAGWACGVGAGALAAGGVWGGVAPPAAGVAPAGLVGSLMRVAARLLRCQSARGCGGADLRLWSGLPPSERLVPATHRCDCDSLDSSRALGAHCRLPRGLEARRCLPPAAWLVATRPAATACREEPVRHAVLWRRAARHLPAALPPRLPDRQFLGRLLCRTELVGASGGLSRRRGRTATSMDTARACASGDCHELDAHGTTPTRARRLPSEPTPASLPTRRPCVAVLAPCDPAMAHRQLGDRGRRRGDACYPRQLDRLRGAVWDRSGDGHLTTRSWRAFWEWYLEVRPPRIGSSLEASPPG